MYSGGIYALPLLVNQGYLQGLTTLGAAVNLIGVNSGNLVSIDPQAVGVTVGGFVQINNGLLVVGAVGAGHARIDAQIEVDNSLGGHALISIYNKFSPGPEEGALVYSANLSNGAAAQMASIFNVFVNDVNTFNNYQSALGFHLPDSTSDMNPLNLFSNNSAQLVGGATAALLWDSAPASNTLAIGRTANVVTVTINTTAFKYDPTINGSIGAFGFGAASLAASYFYEEQPALTTAANASYYRHLINNANAITIGGGGAGTAPVIATLVCTEPNIVLNTNAVTIATSFHIPSAPTEGGSNYAEYIQAGAVRWGGYGAGAATFDANGNITSVSDETAKDVQGDFMAGLAELRLIQPILYKWRARPGVGMDTEGVYAGFGARNVGASIPLAVGQSPDGFFTLQDRALLAAVVNAVKELDRKSRRSR